MDSKYQMYASLYPYELFISRDLPLEDQIKNEIAKEPSADMCDINATFHALHNGNFGEFGYTKNPLDRELYDAFIKEAKRILQNPKAYDFVGDLRFFPGDEGLFNIVAIIDIDSLALLRGLLVNPVESHVITEAESHNPYFPKYTWNISELTHGTDTVRGEVQKNNGDVITVSYRFSPEMQEWTLPVVTFECSHPELVPIGSDVILIDKEGVPHTLAVIDKDKLVPYEDIIVTTFDDRENEKTHPKQVAKNYINKFDTSFSLEKSEELSKNDGPEL